MDEKKQEINVSASEQKNDQIAQNEVSKPEIVIENTQEKKKELTKDEKEGRYFKNYALVLILLIVLAFVGFFYFKNLFSSSKYNTGNKDNFSSDQPSSSNPLTNEMSIADPKVTQFNSLFIYEKKGISKIYPSINSKEKTTSSLLVMNHQLSIAINDYLKSNTIADTYATCDDLASTNFTYVCSDDNFALIDNKKMIIYRFTAENLKNSYDKIFGNQTTIVHKNFEAADGTECFYSNDNYLCLKGDQEPAGIESVSYIIDAFEYSDRMEINIKYVWLEGTTGYSNIYQDTTYFDNYFANPAITDEINIKQNYNSSIPITKYTFIKNADGNYYWDSSIIVEN